MTNPDQLFPDHPALVVSRSVGRSLYTGIAEVLTRDELRQRSAMQDNPPTRASQETEVTEELRPGENPMVNKVSGYRKLDDNELALVNELKADGERIAERLKQVEALIQNRTQDYGTPDGEHYRALALGKTNIQQGYMWLIRAVAAPEGLV